MKSTENLTSEGLNHAQQIKFFILQLGTKSNLMLPISRNDNYYDTNQYVSGLVNNKKCIFHLK